MPTLIKTKGIVLHEMPIKEQDKRIILFREIMGKWLFLLMVQNVQKVVS